MWSYSCRHQDFHHWNQRTSTWFRKTHTHRGTCTRAHTHTHTLTRWYQKLLVGNPGSPNSLRTRTWPKQSFLFSPEQSRWPCLCAPHCLSASQDLLSCILYSSVPWLLVCPVPLSACLYVCWWAVYLVLYLPSSLYVCLSTCCSISFSICHSVCLNFCLYICQHVILALCMSVCLPFCLSENFLCLSLYSSGHLFACLPIFLSVIYLTVFLPVWMPM